MTTNNGPEVVHVDEFEEADGGLTPARPTAPPPFTGGKAKYSPEFLKECEEFLQSYEIEEEGGYRGDERKSYWWMDLAELLEFEKANARIVDDKEFWAWWKKYREDGHAHRNRSKVSWYDNFKGKASGTKNYLKDWWTGWGYSGASETTRKLAVAIGAVTSVVAVINSTGKRYQVEFADDTNESPQSFTNFENRLVVVSPQAMLDKAVTDDAEAIGITTGFALHEASHVEYSEPIRETLLKPTKLYPLAVSAMLWNVLEDLRIETLTSQRFPGFAQYFDQSLEYMWGVIEDQGPKQWGPDLTAKVNAVIKIAKWPTRYEAEARADADLSVEFDWWRDWAKRYIDGKNTCRELVEEGLARLREDPNTAKELDEQTKREKQDEASHGNTERMTDEAFRDFIKRLSDGLKKGLFKPCPSPHQPGQQGSKAIRLTEEQSAEVQKLVQEKLLVRDPVLKFPNQHLTYRPKVFSLRPLETTASQRAYRPPQRDIVDRMKSAFFFRKRTPVISDRMLKRGTIDDDQLWRVADGDFRVFEVRTQEEQPESQVTMLIDASGSMYGRKLEIAQNLATIMLECLRTMTGVRVRVRAHTTYAENGDCGVWRLWDKGDPVTRLGTLMTEVDHGSNWDGFAIEYCAEEMLKESRPNEQMVLIVLSDGLPAGGRGYSGQPAHVHVRNTVTEYARKGVTTIQIAIDPHGVRPQDQAAMYDYWIPFESEQRLPEQLTRLLIKLFGANE